MDGKLIIDIVKKLKINSPITIEYHKRLGKFDKDPIVVNNKKNENSGEGESNADNTNTQNVNIRNRPLLVTFKSADEAQQVFNHNNNMQDNFKITLDRTVNQRKLLKEAYETKKVLEEKDGKEYEVRFFGIIPKAVLKRQNNNKKVPKNSKAPVTVIGT